MAAGMQVSSKRKENEWHGVCSFGLKRMKGAPPDKMPKQPKRTQPKVDLREDELKEITVNIRTSVYEAIVEYTEFHKETMGTKPSESRVVDRGMESFFESDEGFQAFQKKRAKNEKEKRQPVAIGEGRKVGGPGNASRLPQGRETSL